MKFVNKQLSIFKDKSALENRISQVIIDPKNKDYLNYMSNPLLLTMFIFTYKNHPELPHKKSKFYYNVFETLYTRHDNFSKSGDIHERKTELKIEDFENILKCFSLYSYYDGQFNFDKQYFVSKLEHIRKVLNYSFNIEDLIYDLTVSIGIIIIDGLKYKFPHRSLQEYFIALLMSQRPSEKKKESYKQKYFGKRQTPEYNLWTISDELDQYYFRLALISELEELLNILYKDNIEDSVFSYLETLELKLIFDKNKFRYLGISYNSRIDYLLSYFGEASNFKVPINYFVLTKWLRKEIKTNDILKLNFSYSIDPINSIRFINQDKSKNIETKSIQESNESLAINFVRDINIHLVPYFKEIGLDLFVGNLLDKIGELKKPWKNRLRIYKKLMMSCLVFRKLKLIKHNNNCNLTYKSVHNNIFKTDRI